MAEQTVELERFEHMRANRDLWVRRHMALERVIQSIHSEIEHFEENVETVGDWRHECSSDDLIGLGMIRVLCELTLDPRMLDVTAAAGKPAEQSGADQKESKS